MFAATILAVGKCNNSFYKINNLHQYYFFVFVYIGDKKALEIQQEKMTSGVADKETATEKEKAAEKEKVSTEKRKQEKRARGRPRKEDKTKPAKRRKTESAFSIKAISSPAPQLVVQSVSATCISILLRAFTIYSIFLRK